MRDKNIRTIEKLIINWATPIEGLIAGPMIFLGGGRDKFQNFFDEYGVFRGMWKSKDYDYGRLIDFYSQEDKDLGKGLELYNRSICGLVMKVTYKIFRGK